MRTTAWLVWLPLSLAAFAGPAQVSETTLTLPTYLEGDPDPNPRFDLFVSSNFYYPYTTRTNFTNQVVNHAWRALVLENEFLRCTFLPDLGGHLYTCADKVNGHPLFYANPSVRKEWIAPRGSWAALGVELNFPVTHSWTTVSPVDFAAKSNSDGSASVWLGGTDRVYGMTWRAEFVLQPGQSVLEQRITLYNGSDVRHRYLWWTNAAVRKDDGQDRFLFPTYLTQRHGDPWEVDTWPVNSGGIDLSAAGNHPGQLGLFAIGSNEPFFGLYHATQRNGVAHYSELTDLPGKKLWTWGDAGDSFVRSHLSGDGSTYNEIQSGVFPDQSSYGFLEPHESRRFTEYWMPLREMTGLTRVTRDLAFYAGRSSGAGASTDLRVELLANRSLNNARIQVLAGAQIIAETTATLTPAALWAQTFSGLDSARYYTIRLLDSSGGLLLSHTENQLAAKTAADIPLGPRPTPNLALETEQDFLRATEIEEQNGNLPAAANLYRRGLERFPASLLLGKAAGRFSCSLNRFQEAVDRLAVVAARLPDDAEAHYYLGLAYAGLEADGLALAQWESIAPGSLWSRAASLEATLARARMGDYARALAAVRASFGANPDEARAGAVEVTLLRATGALAEAIQRLDAWQTASPADTLLRFERVLLGAQDATIWRHLAADPERVLGLAAHYFDLGRYQDALVVLDHTYSAVDSFETEPGSVLPQANPLIVYYRAFAKAKLGMPAAADYQLAFSLNTRYVFPDRRSSRAVLQAAILHNPNDTTARFLLGSLLLSFQFIDEAIEQWFAAEPAGLPALHRSLGRAILQLKRDPNAALPVLRKGAQIEPGNADLVEALNQAEATKLPNPCPGQVANGICRKGGWIGPSGYFATE